MIQYLQKKNGIERNGIDVERGDAEGRESETQINEKKTKMMRLGKQLENENQRISIKGYAFEVGNSFKYLSITVAIGMRKLKKN